MSGNHSTPHGGKKSHSVGIPIGCWRRGFGLWSQGASCIPESGSSTKVPARILGQMFQARIVVIYYLSAFFVRSFSS